MQKIAFSAALLKYSYKGTQSPTLEFPNFKLHEGEIVLLKGPSGSGKTTLLRLIENSLDRKECIIEVDNKAALIYQDLRLVSEKTVIENVLMGALAELPAHSTKFKNQQIDKALELCKAVGLLDHSEKLVSELSGGQKQRVAILRTLMSSPSILLADECFSQLDSDTAIETFKLIKELQTKYKFTIVISQHTTSIAESEFDRVIKIAELPRLQNYKAKLQFTNFSFALGLIIAAIYSIYTIDTLGFNSTDALSNAAKLLLQFVPSSADLLTSTNWQGLFEAFSMTLKMAFLGALLGFIIAAPLSFLSTTELTNKPIASIFRFALMSLRTLPSLIWALIFVAAVGIGPVAGIFALSLYSAGYLGKLIYESIEDLEQKSFQALRSLGASRLQAFRLGILPQAGHQLVAHFVFMFEYNIRAASLLGLVGAGGIGQELMYRLEWRQFQEAGIILTLLLAIIFVADWLSNRLRQHLLKARGF
jgi:phosphonate transport system permease protein